MHRELNDALVIMDMLGFTIHGYKLVSWQWFFQDFADGAGPGNNGGGTLLHWRNQKFSVFSNSNGLKKILKIN